MQLLPQNLNIHLKCQAQEQLQGTSNQSVIWWVGSQGCGEGAVWRRIWGGGDDRTGFKCWLHRLLTVDPLGEVHSCTCFPQLPDGGWGLIPQAAGKGQASCAAQRAQHRLCPFSHQRGREMTSDLNTHFPGAQALLLSASWHLPLPTRCVQVLCVLASWGGRWHLRTEVLAAFVSPRLALGWAWRGSRCGSAEGLLLPCPTLSAQSVGERAWHCPLC